MVFTAWRTVMNANLKYSVTSGVESIVIDLSNYIQIILPTRRSSDLPPASDELLYKIAFLKCTGII